MRILNQDKEESIRNLLILLTPEEAKELKDDLELLLSQDLSQGQNHAHINDSDYQREITIAIYTPNNYTSFNDKVKKLISNE